MNLFLFWFILALPAFAANMAPVLAQRFHLLEGWATSIDRGATFRGKRIFGDHKTFRGFFCGIMVSMVIALVFFLLWKQEIFPFFGLLNLSQFLLFGFLAGFGALAGDALESFFKRQIGIASGRPFFPFDQIDYLLGFLVVTSGLVSWTWTAAFFLLACGLILNPLTNLLAYCCGVKKTYW